MVNLRTFDLNLLRTFEAIFRDGSVSRAADQLGISQSAVSNALSRLRYQLDDPLFIRSNRGMEPTPKAVRLASTLLEGMTIVRSALAETATFDPATSTRRFTLLMTDVGEIAFLPVILPRLSREAPNVNVVVLEHGLERYAELLDNGTADLAIGRIALTGSLCSEPINAAPFVVMLMRDHPDLQWTDGKPSLSFDSYIAARHVLVQPRGAIGDPVSEALGPNARRRRIALSIPHATALPMIIDNTDLMATVPEIFAQYARGNSGLITVPAPFPIGQTFVQQWWHKRNSKDPGHRWLRATLTDAAV